MENNKKILIEMYMIRNPVFAFEITKEQFENGMLMHKMPIALSFNDMASFRYILDEICKSDSGIYDDYIERAYRTVMELYTIETNSQSLNSLYNSIKYE